MKKESRENIQKELLELRSSLNRHSWQERSEVPQDYFENLPQAISNQINLKREQNSWVNVFTSAGFVPGFASIALIIAVVFGFLLIQSGKDQGYLTDYDEAVYDDYFSFVSDLDHSMIYEVTSQDVIHGEQAEIDPEREILIDYVVDMLEYTGLDPHEVVTAPE